MNKSFAKEIRAELEAMREGRSKIEPCLEKEAPLYQKPRKGFKSVEVRADVYKRLEKLANNQHKDISDVIGTLVKGLK